MVNLDNLRRYTDIYDDLVQNELIKAIEEGQDISKVIDVIIDIDKEKREIQFGLYRRSKLQPPTRLYDESNVVDPRKIDGVPILVRHNPHKLKVNHRNHTDFFNSIINNKTGYFLGIPIGVSSEDEGIDAIIKDVVKNLDLHSKLMDVASSSVGQGEGFLLLSSPQGGTDIEISVQRPFHCVVLYENKKAKYGLIYYPTLEDLSKYECYWYTETTVQKYEGPQTNLVSVGEEELHLFSGVPLIEFSNNSGRISDTEKTVGLQDVYDIIDSDLSSEISQLRLAYLMMVGFGSYTDNEEYNKKLIETFKQTGLLFGSGDSSIKQEAKFIEKNLNYEAIEYMKNDLQRRIYKHSNSYDPDTFSGIGSNVTKFQLEMMLYPLEQSTVKTEVEFRSSIFELFSLIADYNSNYNKAMSYDINKLSINFTRNVPKNVVQDVKDSTQSGYLLSQNQLNKLLPLDVDQEINKKELEEEGEMVEAGILEDNQDII